MFYTPSEDSDSDNPESTITDSSDLSEDEYIILIRPGCHEKTDPNLYVQTDTSAAGLPLVLDKREVATFEGPSELITADPAIKGVCVNRTRCVLSNGLKIDIQRILRCNRPVRTFHFPIFEEETETLRFETADVPPSLGAEVITSVRRATRIEYINALRGTRHLCPKYEVEPVKRVEMAQEIVRSGKGAESGVPCTSMACPLFGWLPGLSERHRGM